MSDREERAAQAASSPSSSSSSSSSGALVVAPVARTAAESEAMITLLQQQLVMQAAKHTDLSSMAAAISASTHAASLAAEATKEDQASLAQELWKLLVNTIDQRFTRLVFFDGRSDVIRDLMFKNTQLFLLNAGDPYSSNTPACWAIIKKAVCVLTLANPWHFITCYWAPIALSNLMPSIYRILSVRTISSEKNRQVAELIVTALEEANGIPILAMNAAAAGAGPSKRTQESDPGSSMSLSQLRSALVLMSRMCGDLSNLIKSTFVSGVAATSEEVDKYKNRSLLLHHQLRHLDELVFALSEMHLTPSEHTNWVRAITQILSDARRQNIVAEFWTSIDFDANSAYCTERGVLVDDVRQQSQTCRARAHQMGLEIYKRRLSNSVPASEPEREAKVARTREEAPRSSGRPPPPPPPSYSSSASHSSSGSGGSRSRDQTTSSNSRKQSEGRKDPSLSMLKSFETQFSDMPASAKSEIFLRYCPKWRRNEICHNPQTCPFWHGCGACWRLHVLTGLPPLSAIINRYPSEHNSGHSVDIESSRATH